MSSESSFSSTSQHQLEDPGLSELKTIKAVIKTFFFFSEFSFFFWQCLDGYKILNEVL